MEVIDLLNELDEQDSPLATHIREYLDKREKAFAVIDGLSNRTTAKPSFKIRHPHTGLFRTRTSSWSRQGTTWTTKGHMHQHLKYQALPKGWEDWTVVELRHSTESRLGDVWSPK